MAKRKTEIVLSPSLTIENIKKAREDILDGLSGFTQIVVDVNQVERIDLSGIQLLLSLFRKDVAKKEIHLKGRLQEGVLASLVISGFIPERVRTSDEVENELRQFA